MYLNITGLSQKPYLFTNERKRLTHQNFKFDTIHIRTAHGWWCLLHEGKIPGTAKWHCLHLAIIPSRAESTETSADSFQKCKSSKSSWGFWKQSRPIFCWGGEGCIWRHNGTLSQAPFGTLNEGTSSSMSSESLTPSGTSAPSALKQPQWVLFLENMPALCPSHPWLLPKIQVHRHLSPHTFILCAFFIPVATLLSS